MWKRDGEMHEHSELCSTHTYKPDEQLANFFSFHLHAQREYYNNYIFSSPSLSVDCSVVCAQSFSSIPSNARRVRVKLVFLFCTLPVNLCVRALRAHERTCFDSKYSSLCSFCSCLYVYGAWWVVMVKSTPRTDLFTVQALQTLWAL